MTTPMTGINPPFKKMTDTVENNNIRNRKNKPDNNIEIPLLKIINYTYYVYGPHHIKTLGMPKNYDNKYINIKIVKLNYISLKIFMVD